MGRLCQALSRLSPWPVRVEGYTDLAVGDRKFSGNAQYRRRGAILFHGTFMLDFDLALIEELLAVPARVPRYRRGRSHLEFLTNLAISRFDLGDALREAWGATASLGESERETLLSQIRARSLVLEI
jgi:lipoate-protein ligase A